jgi:uncharacterized protein (TIGR03067 family)
MLYRLVFGLAVLVGLTAFAPAPFPKKGRPFGEDPLDLKRLQGTWKVVKVEKISNGKYQIVRDPVTHVLIQDDQWVFMHGKGKRSTEYRILVDPSKRPAWCTFRGKNQATGGTEGLIRRRPEDRIQVLYRWGHPRPGNFEKPPSGSWAITLKRDS